MIGICIAGAVRAQVQPTPPERYTLDPRGVDLVTGKFSYATTDLVIGDPRRGGLVHGRVWANGGWRDTLSGSIAATGLVYTVSLGAQSEIFIRTGSTYTPTIPSGATLTQHALTGRFEYKAGGGQVATFEPVDPISGIYSTVYENSIAILKTLLRPNGERIEFELENDIYCAEYFDGECVDERYPTRVMTVHNNYGYTINYSYQGQVEGGVNPAPFFQRTSAFGFNRATEFCYDDGYCDPTLRTTPGATYTVSGVRVVGATDQSGRATIYSYSTGGLSGIRLPGSAANDVAITYEPSGRVASVTDATGAWTYTYSDSGSTRTTTANGPGGQQLVAVSDLTIGQATAVTNALSQTTSYAYDGQNRLQRVTNPEGDYSQYAYDGRGNVTQIRRVAKPGSGLADIVTSSAYPASCSNPITCNLPTSTTDASGNVTEYTYDATHGGVLTVTQPAPTSGAVRPQVRVTYAAQSALVLNSSAVLVATSPSITLPVEISNCVTTASCDGTADERVTAVAYGAASNLQPSSITRGSGATPSMAVTAMTYTPNGDVETVDGPLSGPNDITRYRYDNARQRIGVVGPDPDGAGALPNRAERSTYNARGLVTVAESGTTAGQGDVAWAAFTPAMRVETDYDSFGRTILVELDAGGVAPVTQQQFSYNAAGQIDCQTIRMTMDYVVPTNACTPEAAGPNGPDRITRTAYDVVGRPLSTTTAYGLPDAAADSLTYTANGRTASVTDGNGNTTVYTYDGFDRPNTSTMPGATYEQTNYDSTGQVTGFRLRDGQTISIARDALGRVTTKSFSNGELPVSYTYDLSGAPLTISGAGTLTYSYDGLGRNIGETSTLGTVSAQYDSAGRLSRTTWADGNYISYDYLTTGQVSAVRENGGLALGVYAYDTLGRLQTLTYGNGVVKSYGYDAASRLTSLSDDLGGTTQDQAISLTYNPAGQIVGSSRSNDAYAWTGAVNLDRPYTINGLNQYASAGGTAFGYDGRGNLTSSGGDTYAYSLENRLISSSSGAALIFDPALRLSRVSLGEAVTQFGHFGDKLVSEHDASGAILRRYAYGAGDTPLVWYDGPGLSNRRWLSTDERGSVTAVTDGSGSGVTLNAYDEYGIPAAGNVGRFQYTGQAWIPELGMYHYRARTYSPTLGRFLQFDPIGYKDGLNAYAYVRNDPLNWTDRSGTDRVCVTPTGSRIRRCVTVAGGADEDNLTPAQERAIAEGLRGFILANPGRDLNSFGKAITYTPGTPRSDVMMAWAVSQFIGFAASRSTNDEFRSKWNSIASISIQSGRYWGNAPAGYSAEVNKIILLAPARDYYSSPSDLARVLIHEGLHYGQADNLANNAYMWLIGHDLLDRRACDRVREAGLDGVVPSFGSFGRC